MATIAGMLGYEATTNWNSFRYLGISIHKGIKKKVDRKELVQKIKNKIQAMGVVWLNPAGKMILINAVLVVFPVFICSTSLAPKSIIQEIKKELRWFLWQGGKHDDSRKLHLIS